MAATGLGMRPVVGIEGHIGNKYCLSEFQAGMASRVLGTKAKLSQRISDRTFVGPHI